MINCKPFRILIFFGEISLYNKYINEHISIYIGHILQFQSLIELDRDARWNLTLRRVVLSLVFIFFFHAFNNHPCQSYFQLGTRFWSLRPDVSPRSGREVLGQERLSSGTYKPRARRPSPSFSALFVFRMPRLLVSETRGGDSRRLSLEKNGNKNKNKRRNSLDIRQLSRRLSF